MPDSNFSPTEQFPWSLPQEPSDERPEYFPPESPKSSMWSRSRVGVVAGLAGLLLGLAIGTIGETPEQGKQFSESEVDDAVDRAVKHAEDEFAAQRDQSDSDAADQIARLKERLKSADARAKLAAARAREARQHKAEGGRAEAGQDIFAPPPGWTTDALTPGYTGCRQGYPGGRVNGVYVWKPIPC